MNLVKKLIGCVYVYGSSLTCFDVVVSVCPIENRQLHQLDLLQIIFSLRLGRNRSRNVNVHLQSHTHHTLIQQKLRPL